MSIAEKIAHTAETFTGNVKKMAGRVTGSLAALGRRPGRPAKGDDPARDDAGSRAA